MSGSEVLLPEKDFEIDVDLTIYKSSWFSRGIMGYTFPSVMKTWMNRRFLSSDSAGLSDVAGNIVHEWCHNLGFNHSHKSLEQRKYSVPYAVGNIIKELCEEDSIIQHKHVKRLGFWKKIGSFFRNIF